MGIREFGERLQAAGTEMQRSGGRMTRTVTVPILFAFVGALIAGWVGLIVGLVIGIVIAASAKT